MFFSVRLYFRVHDFIFLVQQARDQVFLTSEWTPITSAFVDLSDPELDISLAATTPYGYAEEGLAVYGLGGGTITLTIAAADSASGLDTVVIPDTTAPGSIEELNGAPAFNVAYPYAFSASDVFSGQVSVVATDQAGRTIEEVFTVIRDIVKPTVALEVQAAGMTADLTWGPASGETDIAYYDVQYSNDNGVTWQPWLTNTTDTQAQFPGDPGQAYYFRVRATDDVGNAGAWTVSSLVSIKSVTKYYHHGGARVAMRKDGEVYYLHGDHLGSTSLTTDSDGNVVSEARYHPFGSPRWQDGVAVTDFTFTSQRVERGFGLMDYNARYYSPYLGRFVSADTIVPDYTDPQTLNRYAYGYNNPVRYYDDDGHCLPFCIPALIALAVAPRESIGYGSRQVAKMDIPVVSDFAAWDARTADQLWQAVNGEDLQGNSLTTEERVEIGVEGYANAVGEAVVVGATIETIGAIWQTGKYYYDKATGNQLIDDVLENELGNVNMTVKPTYNPKLKSAYGAAVEGQYSQIGKPSMQGGRVEVVDTILHEEMHQRLWTRGLVEHSEDYIMAVTRRFTQMKGLGIAPSQ